jgi:hypothetical protein
VNVIHCFVHIIHNLNRTFQIAVPSSCLDTIYGNTCKRREHPRGVLLITVLVREGSTREVCY